jgi:hypothetical protein
MSDGDSKSGQDVRDCLNSVRMTWNNEDRKTSPEQHPPVDLVSLGSRGSKRELTSGWRPLTSFKL